MIYLFSLFLPPGELKHPPWCVLYGAVVVLCLCICEAVTLHNVSPQHTLIMFPQQRSPSVPQENPICVFVQFFFFLYCHITLDSLSPSLLPSLGSLDNVDPQSNLHVFDFKKFEYQKKNNRVIIFYSSLWLNHIYCIISVIYTTVVHHTLIF